MFESVGRSWELMKKSLGVLQKDKELMLFPIVSTISAIILMVLFFVPLFTVEMFKSEALFYAWLFLTYVVLYFVTIFFNAALIGAANIRLNGGDPKLSDGIAAAKKNLRNIFLWAIIAATVGLILNIIRDKIKDNNWIGKIIIGFIGAAWNIATYFVVPVLVMEGVGPFDAIKKSLDVVKNKFGETAIGGFGIGILSMILWLIVVGIGIAVGIVGGFIAGIATVVILGVLVFSFTQALEGIYITALYNYAKNGEDKSELGLNNLITLNKEKAESLGM